MDKLDSWVKLLVWVHDNVVVLPLKILNAMVDINKFGAMQGAFGNPVITETASKTVVALAVGMATIFGLMRIFKVIDATGRMDFAVLVKPVCIALCFIGITEVSYDVAWTVLKIGEKIVDGLTNATVDVKGSTAWIESLLKDRDLGGQIVASLFIIVTYAITCFCYVSVIGLVIGRVVNLWVSLYISPIFVAMLGNEQYGGMGASFLKTLFINYISVLPIYLLFRVIRALPDYLVATTGGGDTVVLGVTLVGALILWKLSSEVNDIINRIVSN